VRESGGAISGSGEVEVGGEVRLEGGRFGEEERGRGGRAGERKRRS